MVRPFFLRSLTGLALVASAAGEVWAQEVSAREAVAAIEQVLVDAIARAEKSVVAIARVRKVPSGDTFPLEFRPDPFGRTTVTPAAPQPTDPEFIPNEYGTGVVVDRRGLILTAYHVLGEDSEYYVRTHDRKAYRAWIKGADPRSDLAVLAIDAPDLEPIAFGDAAKLNKGHIVIALGNPYAIARDGQISASWGIVANLARKAPPRPDATDASGKRTLHHFGTLIQTDAKLNLGTSGGPLLNLDGEMVGLCVALAATAGYEKAAGYAIPVDRTFRRVVETLKRGREVEYGFLGIEPANLRPREILAGMQGIRVSRVVPGTPAARPGGLEPNDIITAVGGAPLYDADSLVLEVGRLPVDSVARLSIIRDGRRRTLGVTLTKYRVRGKKIVTNRPEPWRGMRVDYPTTVVDSGPRQGNRMPFYDEGVIVTDVAEASPAFAAGLRRGMRVTHVGGEPVRTPKEFFATVAGRRGPIQLRLADNHEDPVRTVAPES